MKAFTFRIDTKADVEDLEDLLKLLNYKVIMVDFTLDQLTNVQFLGVYTIAVPKSQTIRGIKEIIYKNIHTHEQFSSLKKVYLTIKEGIYPNDEWIDDYIKFLL